MAQRKTNLPPADYKTFEELVEYAKQRAQISIKRRGHQEAAYWIEIQQFAAQHLEREAMLEQIVTFNQRWIAEAVEWFYLGTDPVEVFRNLTKRYAWCVHCCKMLRNRGEKAPQLSLKWLREAAKKL